MDEIALLQKLFLSWVIGIWAAVIIGMSAIPVLAEDVSVKLSYENDASEASLTGLRKIEDGSVVSNLHTSKWRVFTDNGRDLFLQGKLEEAECFFLSALQEAKEGFGEKDPHIASAYNNLAELYRVKKAFDKAEPLYLEAINILEESFGLDDIRVGAALHNLGQFYLVQRKLEEARNCYQAIFICNVQKLIFSMRPDNIVVFVVAFFPQYFGQRALKGKEKDSEALIQDSIWILEQGGLGESMICIRRLRYLAQIYVKSNRPADAENVQRKILRMMELSKGWNSLDTVIAAEGLALTLQSVGSLREAQELLERCLDARETLLPKDHIQIAANMLHIARVEMLISSQQRKTNIARAIVHLDKSKDLLDNAIRSELFSGSFFGSCSGPNQALKHQIVCTKMQLFKDSKHFLHDRIAQQVLDKMTQQKGNQQSIGVSREMRKAGHTALVILLQSLNALGQLEISKAELQDSKEKNTPVLDPEEAFHQCILAFKEFASERSLSDSPEVKFEYLSCLKHLSSLMSTKGMDQGRSGTLQMLKDEIKRVELELSPDKMRKN
ncbi:unnamed protein product [Ilex paraguariensis]|uniref:Uncharacterized protein n=1 Tax=Ilex paraguariensis TaxID=185542 RepID=A0ABC8TMZ0_9AQUA